MRRRALTERDRAEWASYVRQVQPMPGVLAPDLPDLPPPAVVPDRVPPLPVVRPQAAPVVVGTAPGGVDSATWTRFRTGKLPVARTLDLHGQTAQRAFTALHRFLGTAMSDRLRCVEVITGRGSGEGGVIRREFPLWLNGPELRPWVLAAAHPHPANPGSVRLLLRRVR